jgi:hypothetical protein
MASLGECGAPNANGVQLFFKSRGPGSDTWYSFYSSWRDIEPSWEQHWVEFTANPSGPAGYVDPQFDPTRVIAIGIKVAINSSSNATLAGTIYLDDFELDTYPPILFDFETLEAETDLDALKCSCGTIRVFIFADGGAAPEFTPTGEVSAPGFDEYFFQDFDALLEIARQRNLLLMPVLLDFWWCDLPKQVSGVQLGGHSDIIRDVSKRQTFLDNALKPLIQRYASHPHILAWDVINEPEWAIQDIPNDFQVATSSQRRCGFRQGLCRYYPQLGVTVGCAASGCSIGRVGTQSTVSLVRHLTGPLPWSPAELGRTSHASSADPGSEYCSQWRSTRTQRAGGYHGLLAWAIVLR